MTAGWWDAPLALWDLAKAISITTFRVWKNNIGKGRIKDFFKGGGLFEKGGINTLCELWYKWGKKVVLKLILVVCPFEDWPLRTTLWYLLCKKDSIKLKSLPSIPLFLSLCIRSLCQTLSKALDKSRKIPWTSKDQLASKAVKMLCVIAVIWFIEESPGLNPDWLVLSRQFWSKKS